MRSGWILHRFQKRQYLLNHDLKSLEYPRQTAKMSKNSFRPCTHALKYNFRATTTKRWGLSPSLEFHPCNLL